MYRPARLIVQFESSNHTNKREKNRKASKRNSRKNSKQSVSSNNDSPSVERNQNEDNPPQKSNGGAIDSVNDENREAEIQAREELGVKNGAISTESPANKKAGHKARQLMSSPTQKQSKDHLISEEREEIPNSNLHNSLHHTMPIQENHSEGLSQGKGRKFAARFLRRLGNRKERYQGNGSNLQPNLEENDSTSGKDKRSLAKKLLSRRSTRASARSTGDVSDDLSRLTFRGNKASGILGVNYSTDIASSSQLSSSKSTEGSLLEEEFGLDAVPESEDSVQNETIDNLHGHSNVVSEEDMVSSPLTREALERAEKKDDPFGDYSDREDEELFHAMSARGSWLKPGGVHSSNFDVNTFDDNASSILELAEADELSVDSDLKDGTKGVFCSGRLSGFELVGERGSKCPNLTIGRADVRATVFVRFVFEYSKTEGWRPGTYPGDKPVFHVENLSYKIFGNNVPMPPTLIKHILRVAIPGLIQRRILGIMPKELGDYLSSVSRSFSLTADVGVVGPDVEVLDADLGFVVQGPAKSPKDARRQAAKYAAAKEARRLLCLTLPQAQILAEIFNGSASLFQKPQKVSISGLIAFIANYERYPKIYDSLCQVINSAYHILSQIKSEMNVDDFSFIDFMAGPVTRMRRKPANTRIQVRKMDIGIDIDAVVTAVHDFTQRTIEESIIKGPLTDPSATFQSMKDSISDELELLHAWHAFALRELQHFKSKFRGAAGTLLAAADYKGFSAGIENCFYEGPLRMRLPISVKIDPDGAVSFDLPLPTPQGALGIFMDNFKSLMVPSHLRPPAAALNWIRLSGDSELDSKMQKRIETAIEMITETLRELNNKILEENLFEDDRDPTKVLSQPRTSVGDKLGRLIINRMKFRIRLDEKRIGEILSGIDGASMGGDAAFAVTAGRIIGHLGDVMAFGFVPAGSHPTIPGTTTAGLPSAPDRYLMHVESSDISRLRADVQSLGFQSAISPGGAVRLFHAIVRAAQLAFLGRSEEEAEVFREQMKGWYNLMTKEALNITACIDTSGEVMDTSFVVTLSGEADEEHVRSTSPVIITNEIDLVPLGKLMRGDPPESR